MLIKRIKSSSGIVINSTAYFVLSYLVIYFLQQLCTALVALHFDINTSIHINYIDFLIRSDSWTFDSVKVIYSVGVVFSLIISIPCLIIYIRTIEFDGLLRLFFLWGFIHSINSFIGGILVGALSGEGPGYVLSYVYMSDTAKLFIALIGIFSLLGIGAAMVKPMLFSGNSYYNTQQPGVRLRFIFHQFYFPFLLGNAILTIARFPVSGYELMLIASSVLLLMPIFFMASSFTEFYFDESPKEIKVSWRIVMATVIILIVMRIGLQYGLRISSY
jgi:hypothetical protein